MDQNLSLVRCSLTQPLPPHAVTLLSLDACKSLFFDLIQDATFFQLDGLRELLVRQLESGAVADDPVVEF